MNNHLDQQRSCPFSITLVSDGIDDADNFMNEKKLSSITTSIPRQKKEQSLQPSDMDVSLERHHMKLEQPLSSQSIAPYPSTYDIIDLCTPVKSSSSCASSSTCMKTKEYVPRTIGTHNQARLSILPAFPTPIYNDHSHLLLANVPIQFLSIEQLYRRERQQQQLFNPQSPCTLIIHNHSTPSSIRNYFEVYYQPLIDRLNVDWTILDFNYTRLDHCLKLFANERIHRLRQTPYEVRLLEEEKSVAMEFFLQIDVDIFYMKTFSDRNIQPTAKNKGLFCTIEPEHRFIMKPCGQQNCSVCSLSNHITRRSKSSVNFEQNGTYRFLNGYETILNAPVMCNTNGIIYVLKCPCGKYEYVGETSNNLHYTLDRHRINGNRIMHYFLIGEPKRRENKNNVPMDQHSYEY
ncbi:unnamed protein product [Rotaria sp. Silwood2]|nr:unnamed protein product [Rotaria sp. Silwood2]CAF4223309.1 unnamed protein product [Rotaria sp. Silwood2]